MRYPKREEAYASATYAHDLETFERRFGLKVVRKRDSRLMKLLYYVSLMWIWNRRFLVGYTSTIGSTMYVAREIGLDPISDLALLRHEVQHIEDSRRFGSVVWALLYLFPQFLAAFAIFAIFSKWALLFLVFLAPLPAPFRVWAESRGYAKTYVTLDQFGQAPKPRAWNDKMRRTFCGWSYYRMAWNWDVTRAKIWDDIAAVEEPALGSRRSGR